MAGCNRLALGMVLSLLAPPIYAVGLIEQESAMERSLHDRAQRILDQEFTPGKTQITVLVEMDISEPMKNWVLRRSDKSVQTDDLRLIWRSGPDMLQSTFREFAAADPATAEERQAKREKLGLLASSVVLKKIQARVYLDPALPADAEARAVNLIVPILKPNRARGDMIYVYRRSPLLAPSQKQVEKIILEKPSAGPSSFETGVLMLLGTLTLILAATFLALIRQIRQRQKTSPYSAPEPPLQIEQPKAVPAAIAPPAPSPGEPPTPESVPEHAQVQPASHPSSPSFDFLTPRKLEPILDFVTTLSSRQLIMLIPQMPAESAKMLLHHIGGEQRGVILKGMSEAGDFSAEDLEALSTLFKQRLSQVVDGKEKLIALLESTRSEERRQLLRDLEATDPERVKKIRASIMLFEDILFLDDTSWRTLFSHLAAQDAYQAFWQADPAFLKRAEAAMTSRTLFYLQKLRTDQVNVTREEQLFAQEKICLLARRLIKQGWMSPLQIKTLQLLPERSPFSL